MNVFVARATEHQRFAMACCHGFDPGRFLCSPMLLEIFERSDVMDFDVCVRATQLARIGE